MIDDVTDLRHTGLTLAGKVDRAGGRITGDLVVDKELSFGAQTRQMVNLWGTRYGIGVQGSTQYFRTRRLRGVLRILGWSGDFRRYFCRVGKG